MFAAAPADAELLARRAANKEKKGFILGELRPYAMKLHTREQAPKEGRAEAPKGHGGPAAWAPTRAGYLQFLVDSRAVYATLESAVEAHTVLAPLRNTGLERVTALDADIRWLSGEMMAGGGDGGEQPHPVVPPVGEAGQAYATFLAELSSGVSDGGEDNDAAAALPRFLNHFYNYYFAHTAGGRMIGKKMSDMLLDGRELAFYQWEGTDDVKELLAGAAGSIDAIAATWSRAEKDACLEETGNAFKMGGSLLGYLRG